MSHRPTSDASPEQPLQDDPRLTAYALDAEETQAFAAALEGDVDAQLEVDALRALAGELTQEFGGEAAASLPHGALDSALDPERRAAILTEASSVTEASSTALASRATPAPAGRRLTLWSVAALAACVLLALPLMLARDSAAVFHTGTRESAQLERIETQFTPVRTAPGDPAKDPWPALIEPTPHDGSLPAPGALPTPSPFTYRVGPDTVIITGADSAGSTKRPVLGVLLKPEPGSGGGAAGHVRSFKHYEVIGGSGTLFDLHGQPLGGPAFGGRPVRTHLGWNVNGVWAGWNVQTHGEHYVHPGIDGFMQVTKRGGHTSTFSVDVDSASYTNVRRLLVAGQRPHPAAVRIEEFVNYFQYDYSPPAANAEEPFATHVQVAACPWSPKHRLARIALKGKVIERAKRPASNLVFLVDVSGSMEDEDKLPLLRSGLEMLTEKLDARDRVSIVTYASSAALALESTTGDQRDTILSTIRGLKAGGSTNGAGGIQMAYAEAQKHFNKEGVNRVILCTDGDFNVGVSDGPGLTQLVKSKAESGVYLSVLGFGTGNLQDGKMEAYSNAGNGNYAYIDSLREARRVLVEQMEGTLITIAKDVKFQIWFNPKTVAGWRLLGYENRRLAARDFNDDSKDAGDVGAGHEVTALYELIPTGVGIPGIVEPNPFVEGAPKPGTSKPGSKKAPGKDTAEPRPQDDALFIWRLRYKQPDGDTSALLEKNVFDGGLAFEKADRQFQWAAGVTAFGMLLRHSPHRGQATYELVKELATPAKGEDAHGRRAEFLDLVAKAQRLSGAK